ncbi:unnamed protein product, partial [Ectocarpus sp. 6 AP-2014]
TLNSRAELFIEQVRATRKFRDCCGVCVTGEWCQFLVDRSLTNPIDGSGAPGYGPVAQQPGVVVEKSFLRKNSLYPFFLQHLFVTFQGKHDEAGPLHDRTLAI